MPDDLTSCPASCPNRKADAKQGKNAAYVFAMLASTFLAFQCISYERRNEQIPMTLWMPCLLLVGGALGVNIDPATIGSLLPSSPKEKE